VASTIILGPTVRAMLKCRQKRRAQQVECQLRITTTPREITEQVTRMLVIQRVQILIVDRPLATHCTTDETPPQSVTQPASRPPCIR
jgi:hypothetical protein